MTTQGILNQNISEVEKYRKQEAKLEETCKEFEGIMLANLWKQMMKSAKDSGKTEEEKRERNIYQPLEDLSMEMAATSLSQQSGGAGMWKVLYESLHKSIPVPKELQEAKAPMSRAI